MAKTLVIVESPAKARTIERILKDGYEVRASYGHVRDLPESADEIPDEIRKKKWGRLGVDTDGDFTPYYVVPSDKRKYVQALKTALKGATQVYLATDPDREGESISWHLKEILKPKVPVKRIVFHEITEEAITQAVKEAQDVDENLVRAQESRRILDRLYGYTISPVLWKKVQTGLSAGRVQSVAVRLIVDREEERLAFRAATYWDLAARLSGDGREFTATLARLGADRVASGKDFDQKGTLTGRGARVLSEADGTSLVDALWANLPWSVTAVDEKPGVERPAPPFTTSTLTQEASRKLGFSTERTMQAAQRLFQDGHISYHRTDSTTLSDKALADSAAAIRSMFGDEYYDGPRRYATKVKNAQEAHEAIRPSHFVATPSTIGLDRDDARVYELIWKRTMASQMVDARVLRTTVEITGRGTNGEDAVFTASGKAIEFAGFRRAYVEGSDDPLAELEEQETLLPKLTVGEQVERASSGAAARVQVLALEPKRHDTLPPARYTEASLIKELERQGIGRPSTYAATIGTIERRGYIFRQGKALVPSFTAFAVTRLLRGHFGDLIDLEFTAEMEEDLDQISRGEREWLDFIKQFYRGDKHHRGLEDAVKQAEERADYPLIDVGVDAESGETIRVRIGRYGPFLQQGEGGPGRTASLPPNVAPADLTVEKATTLIRAKAEGPRVLGVDPKTGRNVYAIHGRFGAYVQLGETPEKGSKEKPKRSSLTGGQTESTVTLEEALKLLELPRDLGVHPDSGHSIVAGLGRFGPYVKHGDDYRSLGADDDLFTIDLARALALFAEPKRSGRRQMTKRVIRQIEAGDGAAPIQVLEGRYGPYVSDGETNASIPKGSDPATLSLDEARALIDARRGAPSRERRGTRSARRRAARGIAVEPVAVIAKPHLAKAPASKVHAPKPPASKVSVAKVPASKAAAAKVAASKAAAAKGMGKAPAGKASAGKTVAVKPRLVRKSASSKTVH
ncbi:MAG TPA: type I DNA topoisomerase [Vicinamibacterales bacterium]|nr:type I DNA topoisomerase [Vicinamibacterales bacterium]